MTEYQIIDGKKVQLTAKEEAERNADIKSYLDKLETRRMAELRRQRNILLAETDWIVLKAKENNTNIPSDWKTYRQALRDITKTYKSMNDKGFTFPTKPTDTE